MKILVCEDDPVMMFVLKSVLLKFGYNIICTEDGKEALKLIQSESPDMVITDMVLHNFSGTEIVFYLKNISAEKIPVILLSSMPLSALKNEDSYFGADAYLMKPVLPLQLKSTIEELKKTVPARAEQKPAKAITVCV